MCKKRRNTTDDSVSITKLGALVVQLGEWSAARSQPFGINYYCDGHLTIATKM
jgi:hypothetical protein